MMTGFSLPRILSPGAGLESGSPMKSPNIAGRHRAGGGSAAKSALVPKKAADHRGSSLPRAAHLRRRRASAFGRSMALSDLQRAGAGNRFGPASSCSCARRRLSHRRVDEFFRRHAACGFRQRALRSATAAANRCRAEPSSFRHRFLGLGVNVLLLFIFVKWIALRPASPGRDDRRRFRVRFLARCTMLFTGALTAGRRRPKSLSISIKVSRHDDGRAIDRQAAATFPRQPSSQ